MRKKVVLVAFVFIIALLFIVIKANEGSSTIEEAVNPSGSLDREIIHEEKNNKGSIVFSYIPKGDGLYTAIVTKGIGGYKTAYDGVEGDANLAAEKFGLSSTFFPPIEKTALPIYFGLIGNPEISKVKVIEKNRNIVGEAKIVNSKGMRIWLVYMDKFKGSDFDILGLSEDGKEVVRIDGDIAPYYADQKPYKGYE